VTGHITKVPADPGPSVAKMTPPFLYMEWPPHDSKMMLLVTSVDFSLDLTGVHNLRKKHRRIQNKLGSLEPAIKRVKYFLSVLFFMMFQ
jgi:hypothetical protein